MLDIFLHILLPNRASNKEIKVDCALMVLSDVSRYYRHALVSLHLASNLITCIPFYTIGWDRIGYNFAKIVISSCLIPRLSFVTMKEPTTLRMLKPVSSVMALKTPTDMWTYFKIHKFGRVTQASWKEVIRLRHRWPSINSWSHEVVHWKTSPLKKDLV